MQTEVSPRRVHLARLRSIWRSAGWPCRDAVELDLVAAGWAILQQGADGHETIRLTELGIRLLAEARQRNLRSFSLHDRLADRVAAHLMSAGRIVWRELSLRARIEADDPPLSIPEPAADAPMWPDDGSVLPRPSRGGGAWRMARPDVFSVRRTSVEDYLQPMVHEIKASRADLLSDLRHAAKRESYRWLSCETCYVLPAGVAEPQEIPEELGVWLLHGPVDTGVLEFARPSRHVPCKLPFAVWMALAQATPCTDDYEARQQELKDAAAEDVGVAGAIDVAPDSGKDA